MIFGWIKRIVKFLKLGNYKRKEIHSLPAQPEIVMPDEHLSAGWYQLIDEGDVSISQGDFFTDCPVIIPPEEILENGEYEVDIAIYTVAVLSQSCDLENNKVTNVLVCPIIDLEEFLQGFLTEDEYKSKKAKKKVCDALRQGALPGYHLLDKFSENQNLKVVDFRNVYGINRVFLNSHCQKQASRIRLLSPYREHLSQAFARFFMRVGLPQGIPNPYG